MRKVSIIGLIAITLSGCGNVPSVENKPNIYQTTMADVITTDASQRAVLIDKKNFGFCAESSPDVTKDMAAALAEALKVTADVKTGTGAVGGVDIGAGVDLNREIIATALSKILFTPSQGVQLYRVGGFNLCQAWINNTISRNDFVEQHKQLLQIVKELAITEILVRNPSTDQSTNEQLMDILKMIDELQKRIESVSNNGNNEEALTIDPDGDKTQEEVVPPTNSP